MPGYILIRAASTCLWYQLFKVCSNRILFVEEERQIPQDQQNSEANLRAIF